jgi:peptidoglycan/LPS O-acetylase OafA/YrhL/O-antigen/teichoic acid export membrane protein
MIRTRLTADGQNVDGARLFTSALVKLPAVGHPEVRFLRSGFTFLASRALNAALLLTQLVLVSAWYGKSAAAAFFVVWTVGWCGGVWLRFGFDQLLPKHAAKTLLGDDDGRIPSYLPLLRRTLPPLALALLPLLAILLPQAPLQSLLGALIAALLIASSWSITSVLGGLARGFNHVGLAGVVQGVVPALGALAAVPAAAVIDRSWVLLAVFSGACLAVSVLVALWLVVVRVGRAPVRALFSHALHAFDRDLVPAALVTALGETSLWLPVWLASGLGVEARDVAGLYAAARVASVFSWLAATVAAVATPLLAGAVARLDQPQLRRLLIRCSAASALVSAPAALGGILLAGPLLSALGAGYARYSGVLIALIAGRFVDGCTGPLGEALIVGNRARLELVNQVVLVVCLVALGAALEPSLGVLGLGIGAGVAIAACNVPRVVEILMLLRRGWATAHERVITGARGGWLAGADLVERAGLGACAAVSVLFAAGVVHRNTTAAFTVALSLVACALFLSLHAAYRVGGRSAAVLLRTPVTLIAVLWAALFILRPLDLFLDPASTTEPLFELGFSRGDLTWAVAIGALGCATWGLGYLYGLGTNVVAEREPTPRPADPLSLFASFGLLSLGTLLWGALFIRQGGPSALLHHAASIHTAQQSSFYGVGGVWIVQATGLLAFDRLLRGGGRRPLLVMTCAALLSLAAAICLESRGLLVIGALAAVAVYLHARRPTGRALAVGAVIAVLSVGLLAFAERVRSFTQVTSTSHAVTLALKTPPSTYAVADLTPFDNLVTLGELVPASVPRLKGSSIAAIPGAFIPRALWPGKPQPLDQQVSKYLYPGSTVGSPISVQGELWWNFGWPGVAVGALLIGLLMGAVVRRGVHARSEHGRLLYALFFASCFTPMVSALATMASNTAIALAAGAAVAFTLTRARRPVNLFGWIRGRGQEALRRWVLGPRSKAGAPTPTSGPRYPLLDSVRGTAAIGVLICHCVALLNYPNGSNGDIWGGPLGIVSVDCFFVTSGFVLYRPFALARARGTADPDLGGFMKRRVLRLIPAYWTALILMAIAVPAAVPGVGTPHGWVYFLLVSNYVPGGLYEGGLVVSWTLQIELTFYLLLPALAVALRRGRRTGSTVAREAIFASAALILTVGALALVGAGVWPLVIVRSLIATIGWFAIGMLFAAATVAEGFNSRVAAAMRLVGRMPSVVWVGAAAAYVGAVLQGIYPTPSTPHPAVTSWFYTATMALCALAGALIVIPAVTNAQGGGLVRRWLGTRPMRWLGEVSFGIYLYHYPIVYAVTRTGLLPNHGALRLIILIAVAGLVTITLAAFSWYVIERPFIRLSRQRLRLRAAPAVAPGAVASEPAGMGT